MFDHAIPRSPISQPRILDKYVEMPKVSFDAFDNATCPGSRSSAFFKGLRAAMLLSGYGDKEMLRLGVVVCPSGASTDVRASLLEYRFGFSDGSASLSRVISRDEAVALLSKLLHRTQAYETKILSQDQAVLWATAFADSMPGAQFFTNRGEGGEWDPATDSTFDSGVIGVINDRGGEGIMAGIWLSDED